MLAANVRSASLVFPAQPDTNTGAPEIVDVTLQFDLLTGAYEATWTATSEEPFYGHLILDLNLGNARVGPQIVSLDASYLDLAPTTQVTYSGVNPTLTLWQL